MRTRFALKVLIPAILLSSATLQSHEKGETFYDYLAEQQWQAEMADLQASCAARVAQASARALQLDRFVLTPLNAEKTRPSWLTSLWEKWTVPKIPPQRRALFPNLRAGDEFSVEYANQKFADLKAVYDADLDSFAYTAALSPDELHAAVYFSFWHGIGTWRSTAVTVKDGLRASINPQSPLLKKVKARLDSQSLKFIPMSGEAIDLPEGGNGHVSTEPYWGTEELNLGLVSGFIPQKHPHIAFGSIADTSLRLAKHELTVRKRIGKAIRKVGVWRSAAVGLGLQMLRAHPDTFDALILGGPLTSDFEAGFEHSFTSCVSAYQSNERKPNYSAFNWVNEMYYQMDWHKFADPFMGKPTLILVGEYDEQVSPIARDWFRRFSERLPHVQYFEVPGSPHDMFQSSTRRDKDGTVISKYDPVEAFLIIQAFLRTFTPAN